MGSFCTTDGRALTPRCASSAPPARAKCSARWQAGRDRSVTASPRPLSVRTRRRVDRDKARPLGAFDPHLLNTFAAITEKKAGFRSLGDALSASNVPLGIKRSDTGHGVRHRLVRPSSRPEPGSKERPISGTTRRHELSRTAHMVLSTPWQHRGHHGSALDKVRLMP